MRFTLPLLAVFAVITAGAAEKSLKLQDLPPAVQKALAAETGGAELVSLSSEKEKGKTVYEAETKINGHTRDITFDASGAILDLEEEVALASIPAAARTAIEKKASGAKIEKVEKVTQGAAISYEASVLRNGRRQEFSVSPEGRAK